MTKFYVKGATRFYSDKMLDYWVEAEENLGLMNCIYFYENGKTVQWVDSDEAERFFEMVKGLNFNEVMDDYVSYLEKKDWLNVMGCISIMNEVDEHPEIADEDVHRRWKRLRESTHDEFYKIK